jgi:hypothetical protein
MTPVERAAQLVALAASPFEQEARTSAYLACKLIREHGLRIATGEAPPTYRGAPDRGEHHVEAPPFVAGGACRATARYAVVCLDCGALIAEGGGMWWMRGVGGVHERCSPHVLYPRHGRSW